MRCDPDTCRDADLLAAEVRRLLGVIAASEPTLTDEEREVLGSVADDARYRLMAYTERVLRGLLARLGRRSEAKAQQNMTEAIDRVARDMIAILRADGDDDDKDAAAETLLEAICPSPMLTDEEREAVSECYEWAAVAGHRSLAATLRGLLDRTK